MSAKLSTLLAIYHQQNIGAQSWIRLAQILTGAGIDWWQVEQAEKGIQGIFELPQITQQFSAQRRKALKQAFLRPDKAQIDADLQWMQQSDQNHIIPYYDPYYPALLKQCDAFPLLLYVTGNKTVLNEIQIAMVGSRQCSNLGRENATEFASCLAAQGMVITSGLAQGIDAWSHKAALSVQGKTIAVFGTGIDRVYPASHLDLAHQIIEKGAIISQFPLGSMPQRQNFPRRNATISGMSVGTLVVEAALKSGSLITARLAMEQGREVFAIPGSIHNPLAKGCHDLLRQGAKLVESAQDIAEEILPLSLAQASARQSFRIQEAATDNTAAANISVNETQQKILHALEYDALFLDQIMARSGLSAQQIQAELTQMQLQDLIAQNADGSIIKNTAKHNGESA